MEELNPSEISQVIKQKIDALDTSAKPSNEGTVVFLADGIARIHGLGAVSYTHLTLPTKRIV